MIGSDGKSIRYETGLYLFDLRTDMAWKLTGYIEPFALADQNTVLIMEGCMAGFDGYVVSLE